MEDLFRIASSISNANRVFRLYHIDYVHARTYAQFDGEPQVFWLTSASLNTRTPADIRQLGNFVSKNSIFAVTMLNHTVGDNATYSCKNNIHRLVEHNVYIENKADLSSHFIFIAGEPQGYQYGDIESFLAELRSKESEIRANEQRQKELEQDRQEVTDSHRKGEITKEINKLKEQFRILTLQKEELSNLTRYIRQQGKLKDNPILDPVQNRIKTQTLYDGNVLIIEGGPGTGKTTTMIQRLKYLTDVEAIKEDAEQEIGNYKLLPKQRDLLFNAIEKGKDWIFFSPSKLLKDYLSDAMNHEGLTDTKAKVWNWSDYRKMLSRDVYRLVNVKEPDKSPFAFYNDNNELFDVNANVINDFVSYYTYQLRLIVKKLPTITSDAVAYKWNVLAKNIQSRLAESRNYSISQFIQMFYLLRENYYEECKGLLTENRELVSQITTEIQASVNVDNKAKEGIQKLVTLPDAEEGEESIEDETVNDMVYEMLRKWLKQYCFNNIYPSKKLSERNERITDIVQPLLTDSQKESMKRIGELVLFEQFAKYATGVKNNMLRGIPSMYKRFRQQAKTIKSSVWNQQLLAQLISTKRIHPQEQSLLIGFINNLVKATMRITPKADMNHNYIAAYNEVSRPIIGIDEATDFSKYDIYAMESLLSVEFSSMTLCGDMMQRLTRQGIRKWDDITEVVKKPLIVQMNKSYRQSSRLLDVAKHLYKDSVGSEPDYKAYMTSKKVPAPLAFVSDDEDKKISWIEGRIKDVYKAYGDNLPSIAIFLNDKRDIQSFIEQLMNTDFIGGNFEVVDGGSVAADQNQIRVYPIDVVKGMEFDVVFFHNIDKSDSDEDLIKRYIYVGVSRAAFFLGITMNEANDNLLKYFSTTEKWG